NPPSQTVVLQNVGGATLTWTAAAGVTTPPGGTWLSVVATSGSLGPGASDNLIVSVNHGVLGVNSYSGTITVTGGAGTTNSPQIINVTLNVNNTPKINFLPVIGLTFDSPDVGPNPAPQDVTLSNGGAGTLDWTAA